VAVWAAASILALSMLPAEHLHTSDVERPVVHRHGLDDGAGSAGSFIDHDDHRSVSSSDPTYVPERQYDIDRPLITVELVLIRPDRRFVGRVEALDPVMTHGPLIRVRSLRAPPA